VSPGARHRVVNRRGGELVEIDPCGYRFLGGVVRRNGDPLGQLLIRRIDGCVGLRQGRLDLQHHLTQLAFAEQLGHGRVVVVEAFNRYGPGAVINHGQGIGQLDSRFKLDAEIPLGRIECDDLRGLSHRLVALDRQILAGDFDVGR